jgi:hypothetical protein
MDEEPSVAIVSTNISGSSGLVSFVCDIGEDQQSVEKVTGV